VDASKEKGLDVPAVNRMVNKDGGLLGVSGISPDMTPITEDRMNRFHAYWRATCEFNIKYLSPSYKIECSLY
jgi:acetate kinase